jgi:hypothetical protein
MVVVDVQDMSTGTTGTDSTSPWTHSIVINGSATVNGNGTVIGSVYCNQDIRATGSFAWGDATAGNCNVYCVTQFKATSGTATLLGMCYSPSVDAPMGVPRTVQTVPSIALPTLDLTTYYNTALANSQVFAGGTYAGGAAGTIPGGIRWYNGALTMNGGVSYAGCVIATGSINYKGGCTQTKVGTLPAVVSRDSGVTLSGTRSMHGLVYSKGNFVCNGSGRVDGTILIGGSATFNGTYGIFAYEYSNPAGGGSGGSYSPQVGVTAWQK